MDKAEGFLLLTASLLSEQTTSQQRTKLLAIKRAKHVWVPDVYNGQSQKYFNKFQAQLDNVFSAQPTIYNSEENKSGYASSFCKDTSQTDWKAYKKQLPTDFKSEYSFSKLL